MDNFKPINDTYGHNMGDLLLIEVARRLRSCVREVDSVGRFGGDEFGVVLSRLDMDKTESTRRCAIVAEEIRAILDKTYLLKSKVDGNGEITVSHQCTSSIGVVLFFNDQASVEEVIKRADMAMYRAKGAGGNLIRFFDS